ncbi:MAG: RidA family protein [Mycobacteriales bacterium]
MRMQRASASSGSQWEEVIGFARAVRVGANVSVAGTAPVWPDGSCDPDAERQAARCLQIIAKALEDVGASLAHVVRTRIYLKHAWDAEAVGQAHRSAFGEIRPAATMVVVAALLDPRWKVEIEADAVIE